MKPSPRVLSVGLAGLVLLGSVGPAPAQRRLGVYEEPQWLKLRLTQVEAGLYLEGQYDETSFSGSGRIVTHERLFIGPLIGLSLAGSVYHPNFCTLNLASEGAYGQSWETVTATTTTTRNKLEYLGRFNADVNLLNNKPYRLGFFSSYDHTFRDYDFFNRVTLDSLNYGARLSYKEGPWSLNSVLTHRQEETSDTANPTTSTTDTLGVNARHSRLQGSTGLSYSLNRYDYGGWAGASVAGEDHSVTFSDNERFGSRRQFDLNSYGSYSHRTHNTGEPDDQLSAAAELTAAHRHNLRTYYALNFARYESGNLASSTYSGNASVSHQLFESLSSSLQLGVVQGEFADRLSDGYNRTLTATWGEAYTKRLTAEHTLRIFNSLTIQRVDQKGVATVENESHTFPTGVGNPNLDRFLLDQPNVNVLSIQIRHATTSQPYTEGIDYSVLQNGVRTEIRRLITGNIPSGTTVLVDYEAEPLPEGGYNNYGDAFQVRVELWNNLWAAYAGISFAMADAPADLRVQDFTRYTAGIEYNKKWFRAGADAEYYDSTDSQYASLGLYQSANFNLDNASSLGVNLSEQWLNHVDAGRQEQNYRLTVQYHRRFTSHLAVNLDTGASLRVGEGVDQQMAIFRPSLQYRYGRTTVSAGYDFAYELNQNSEERLRHKLYVTVRRRF